MVTGVHASTTSGPGGRGGDGGLGGDSGSGGREGPPGQGGQVTRSQGPSRGGGEAGRRGGANLDASQRREAQVHASSRLRQPWGRLRCAGLAAHSERVGGVFLRACMSWLPGSPPIQGCA